MRRAEQHGKIIMGIIAAAFLAAALTTASFAAYPASDTDIPAGSALLEGELIGEKNGWDGSEGTGRAAAFDGKTNTYYDPTAQGESYAYAGMDMGAAYVLTKVMILPREGWLDRFEGACIQGSNDMEQWETLWESDRSARSWDWQEVTDFDLNTGYQYFRYWNRRNHGDVAEVEFYGYLADGSYSGPVLLSGEIIGELTGWDGSTGTGAAAAFDGDRRSYYDPTAQGRDYTYCGIDAGREYILTSARILPRENLIERFKGGSIQGSNDMEDWTTLFVSRYTPSSWDWQEITDFDDNTGYRYFRYWNGENHGDVAEIRLYGVPADGDYTPPTPATLAVEVTEVTVSFDTNGVPVPEECEPITVKIGEPYGELPKGPNLVSSDFFEGWYTARVGGELVGNAVSDTIVTRLSDHTLYAHWRSAEERTEDSITAPIDDQVEIPAENIEIEAEARSLTVPIVCIVVSVLSLAAALVVMARGKDEK